MGDFGQTVSRTLDPSITTYTDEEPEELLTLHNSNAQC